MPIKVKRIERTPLGVMVTFDTIAGEGRGLWQGKDNATLDEYYVEWNVAKDAEWGQDIYPSKQNEANIRLDGDNVVITGVLSGAIWDDISTLSVHGHSFDINVQGIPPNLGTLCEIKIRTVQLQIFPVNI